METCVVCGRESAIVATIPKGGICAACNHPSVLLAFGAAPTSEAAAGPSEAAAPAAGEAALYQALVERAAGMASALTTLGALQILGGVVYLLVGIQSVSSGNVAGSTGLVVGGVTAVFGWLLLQAGWAAGEVRRHPGRLVDVLDNLRSYFNTMLAVTVVSFVLGAVGLLLLFSS